VPWRGFALKRRLGNEMTAPEPNIWANERLNKIENLIAEQEIQKSRIPEMDRVQIVLPIFLQILFKNNFKPCKPVA